MFVGLLSEDSMGIWNLIYIDMYKYIYIICEGPFCFLLVYNPMKTSSIYYISTINMINT